MSSDPLTGIGNGMIERLRKEAALVAHEPEAAYCLREASFAIERLERDLAAALEAAASRERELEARVRELEADSFEKAHDCAAMERERDEAEARAARMEAALFHHGITVKPDGRFEYEDNSVLMGRERCEWSKVVNDAKRYRWLFSAEANGPEDYFNGVMSRVNGVYWGYYDGQPENWGAAIDAAMAGEE